MRRFVSGGVAVFALCCYATTSIAQTAPSHAHWKFLDTGIVAPGASHPRLDARAYGPSGTSPGNSVESAPGAWSESEQGSIGCIVGGTVGMLFSIAAGGANVVNLIAGGGVPAVSSLALYTAMSGVVFGSFCAVGQASTPAVLMAYRQYFEGSEAALQPPSSPDDQRPPPFVSRLSKQVAEGASAFPAMRLKAY